MADAAGAFRRSLGRTLNRLNRGTAPYPRDLPLIWGTHVNICSVCGAETHVVVVFTDHAPDGHPSGPFHLLCGTCLRRDGGTSLA